MEPAKVTFTIEGSPDAIVAALEQLFRQPGAVRSHSAPSALETEATGVADRWSEDDLRRLWRAVTPGARAVLAELAKQPDGYGNEALCNALGADGRTIGGRLSSVGLALRRLGSAGQDRRTRPWSYDGSVYRVDSAVAEIILRLARPSDPTLDTADEGGS